LLLGICDEYAKLHSTDSNSFLEPSQEQISDNINEECMNIDTEHVPSESGLPEPQPCHILTENNSQQQTPPKDKQASQKPKKGSNFVIVETKKLLKLLQRCWKCGKKPKNAKPQLHYNLGTACHATLYCRNCKKTSHWYSQSKIPGSRRYIGNIKIPAVATVVPISYPKLKEFFDLLGIPFISDYTYGHVEKVAWEKVELEYNHMMNSILEYCKELQRLVSVEHSLLYIISDSGLSH
jgi:hypothetical protein